MILVKFVRNWRNYFDGERAGWEDPALVAKLVDELKVAVYVNPLVEEESVVETEETHVDEHKRPNFAPNPELTVSKVTRMNVDALKELAAEHDVVIEEGELKPAILAKVKAVLFPHAEGDE